MVPVKELALSFGLQLLRTRFQFLYCARTAVTMVNVGDGVGIPPL